MALSPPVKTTGLNAYYNGLQLIMESRSDGRPDWAVALDGRPEWGVTFRIPLRNQEAGTVKVGYEVILAVTLENGAHKEMAATVSKLIGNGKVIEVRIPRADFWWYKK